jgi:hypothetical protein
MSDYILSCCSTADLTKEHFEKRDIKYIYSHYQLDGVPYPDDLGQTMPFDKFYQAMTDGADTKTSQINADEFEAFFEPFLQEGKDVLHACLSSGITGANCCTNSFNSFNDADEISLFEFIVTPPFLHPILIIFFCSIKKNLKMTHPFSVFS